MAAKLNGAVDFLQLESYSEGQQIDWGFTSYRRSKWIIQELQWIYNELYKNMS